MAAITIAELAKLKGCTLAEARKLVGLKGGANKYNAVSEWVDGYRFDSGREANYYRQLKQLKAAGEIRYFIRQIPFHLKAKTPTSGKVTLRVDFGVCELDGTMRWIDTKGVLTEAARIKIAMVEQVFGIEIELA